MVTDNHYRWDFIQLSTDTKPTPETSEKVTDGSTLYCSDTSKLYVWCKNNWYERKPLGGGGGGGSYTAGTGIDITDDTISVDTDTIQEKLTAGTNITISDDTISATDTTYSNFVGTDGTLAGTAGLVPAPATTDAGKFLKADGTWDTAGGGGSQSIIELSADDYDYNSGSGDTDGVALWRLNSGLYYLPEDVRGYAGADSDFKLTLKAHFVIIDNDGSNKLIKVMGDSFTTSSNGIYKGFVEYNVRASDGYGIFASNSISAITTGSNIIRRGIAPTSSDVGFCGQLWYDTGNSKLYINLNRPNDYSGNWKEITLV